MSAPAPQAAPNQPASPSQADAVAAALAKARAVTPRPSQPAEPPAAQPATAPAPAPAAQTPSVAPAPAASEGAVWKQFFYDWPVDIPPRGIMVSQQGEAVPFKAFLLRSDVVMLQRPAPDAMGARFLFVPYDEIAIVKLTDPLKQEHFTTGGFEGQLA